MRQTKDRDEYFNSKRVFTGGHNPKTKLYKEQIPEYFRILDNPRNKKTVYDHSNDGMVGVISKNSGWITVTPDKMNRRNPVEKQGPGTDARQTSILTPSWMQIKTKKEK